MTEGIAHGKYSCLSWDIIFELGINNDHIYKNASIYALSHVDFPIPEEFVKDVNFNGEIKIGSDVWIGRGAKLKVSSEKKPLTIGNGAVIAADSVVVKDVPPYAIVGGNPAEVIKYRFNTKIINAMERIAWWDWELEKIHENFHLFNKIERFVKKFDPKRN